VEAPKKAEELVVTTTSTTALEYFKKETSVRRWILEVVSSSKEEGTLSTRLSQLRDEKVTLQAALKDGVLLCKLMLRVSLDR